MPLSGIRSHQYASSASEVSAEVCQLKARIQDSIRSASELRSADLRYLELQRMRSQKVPRDSNIAACQAGRNIRNVSSATLPYFKKTGVHVSAKGKWHDRGGSELKR